jgi:hypothetical protein
VRLVANWCGVSSGNRYPGRSLYKREALPDASQKDGALPPSRSGFLRWVQVTDLMAAWRSVAIGNSRAEHRRPLFVLHDLNTILSG